jgi:hypothetical protein
MHPLSTAMQTRSVHSKMAQTSDQTVAGLWHLRNALCSGPAPTFIYEKEEKRPNGKEASNALTLPMTIDLVWRVSCVLLVCGIYAGDGHACTLAKGTRVWHALASHRVAPQARRRGYCVSGTFTECAPVNDGARTLVSGKCGTHTHERMPIHSAYAYSCRLLVSVTLVLVLVRVP